MDASTAGNQMSGQDKSSAVLSEDVQKRIGQQLRALFDDAAEEPVPDRLLKVLQKLQSEDKK